MQIDPDYITLAVFIGVFALLLNFIFSQQSARQWRNGEQRWRYGEGLYRRLKRPRGGQLLPFHAQRPPMADPALQLSHVMNASFNKRHILNRSEARVFFAVEKALKQTSTDWRVMAQVNLGEILCSEDRHAFMAVNSKRVDMLVIGADGSPIAAIEYQGRGHYQGTSAARDAVKKEALRKAGIGYFEVKAGDKPEDVRRMVMQMVEAEKRFSGGVPLQ